MQVRNNVGFTLIELLVVVLIIGILAAVALPQYTKAVEKSRAAEAMQQLGDIGTAESIYYMTNDQYTKDLTALDLSFAGGTAGGTLTGKSYDVTVRVAAGDKPQVVTVEANRKDGTYSGTKLYLHVDNTGKVTTWCADPGEDKPSACSLVGTWKNSNSAASGAVTTD